MACIGLPSPDILQCLFSQGIVLYDAWSSPNGHGWNHTKPLPFYFLLVSRLGCLGCLAYLIHAVQQDLTRPSEGNAELLVPRVGRGGGARLVPGAIIRIARFALVL